MGKGRQLRLSSELTGTFSSFEYSLGKLLFIFLLFVILNRELRTSLHAMGGISHTMVLYEQAQKGESLGHVHVPLHAVGVACGNSKARRTTAVLTGTTDRLTS